MEMRDWSLLPSDLVNHIGGCLLATNDIDYYMDFRAVYHPWRAATDDPRSSTPADPRFHPQQWFMLPRQEHPSESSSTPVPPPPPGTVTSVPGIRCANLPTVHIFVNRMTNRVVRKDLPLLRRRYCLITRTTRSFIVVVDRTSPYAMRVLNPFTGSVNIVAPGAEAGDFIGLRRIQLVNL